MKEILLVYLVSIPIYVAAIFVSMCGVNSKYKRKYGENYFDESLIFILIAYFIISIIPIVRFLIFISTFLIAMIPGIDIEKK